MDNWAIEVDELTKSYGSHEVLKGLSLRVAAGSVFALLGPNGAGKTTTVRILTTLTAPGAGTAKVAGFDVRAQTRQVRRRISLTGQYAAVDGLQTGRENLNMVARLAGLPRRAAHERAGELLARFDLEEAADRRVDTWSGGMRRRLDLAAGLVVPPSVLFLDEPTTGLDPRSRQQMWEVITELSGQGVTVFLTTQYLEEADRLADRIAIVDGGRVVAEGSAGELKERVAEQRLEVTFTSAAACAAAAVRLGPIAALPTERPRALAVPTDGSAGHVRALLDELDPDRTEIAQFVLHTATLDDVFLTLTQTPAPAPTSA
jgi:ABC-2 type transport system ATP-binding protein